MQNYDDCLLVQQYWYIPSEGFRKGMCHVGKKNLGEMMLVENIEPLLNELLHWAFALSFWLLTKHIKNKTLQFITLYWQECGREAGDGWAPAILFSKEHFSGRPAIY